MRVVGAAAAAAAVTAAAAATDAAGPTLPTRPTLSTAVAVMMTVVKPAVTVMKPLMMMTGLFVRAGLLTLAVLIVLPPLAWLGWAWLGLAWQAAPHQVVHNALKFKWLRQLAEAFSYLHSKSPAIVHGSVSWWAADYYKYLMDSTSACHSDVSAPSFLALPACVLPPPLATTSHPPSHPPARPPTHPRLWSHTRVLTHKCVYASPLVRCGAGAVPAAVPADMLVVCVLSATGRSARAKCC